MTEADPAVALQHLDASTSRYRETEAAHDEAREATIRDVVAALRAGAGPSEVTRHSPFTDAHVRKIAREHDVPPARPGIKAKPKARRTPPV